MLLVHRRSFLSLITPYKHFKLRGFFFGFTIWISLNILTSIITWLVIPHSFNLSFHFPDFFYFLPVVLLFIPLQCLAEEVFFRGYLLQGLSSILKNAWVLSLVNGAFFVLLHLSNPEVPQSPIIMILYYLLTGFLLSLVTIRTNSLEVAIGAHTANNLFAAVLANCAVSSIRTNSIFTRTTDTPPFDFVMFVISGFIFYWLVMKSVSPASK